MIYIVTSGSYSDYTICGVFDDKEKAETFCEFHAHDEVEEHEVNPTSPPHNLLRFSCNWYADLDKCSLFRISNEDHIEGDDTEVEVGSTVNKELRLHGYSWARSKEAAERGWRDRIRAVKAGEILPVYVKMEYRHEVQSFKPVKPALNLVRTTVLHYRYDDSVEGKLIEVGKLVGEWV